MPAVEPVAELPDPPWERIPEETDVAFDAFVKFRDMGPSRAVSGAYGLRKGKKGPASGRMKTYVQRFRWWERASAYDVHLDHIRRQEVEQAERERVRRWARYRDDDNEVLRDLGHELRRHCLHVFQHPVLAEVPQGDGSTALVERYSAHQVRAATEEAERANNLIRQALADMLGLGPGAVAQANASGASPAAPLPQVVELIHPPDVDLPPESGPHDDRGSDTGPASPSAV